MNKIEAMVLQES